jgi:hypothetical protein
MSHPYQFSEPDRITSPLYVSHSILLPTNVLTFTSDRKTATTIPPSQAPSFKTDVARHKTKKWVEAKSASYGGDDWGEYDEYDEYGVDEPPPVPTTTNLGPPPAGARNFTGPVQSLHGRAPSFEKGDERRVLSTGSHPPIQSPSASQPAGRVVSGASMAHTDISEASTFTPENRRDFSPTALPPPLQTTSAANTSVVSPIRSPETVGSPTVRSPSAGVYDPRSSTPTGGNKALPFIRPADIYKRIGEAREQERRASMESSNSGTDGARPGSSASMQRTSFERIADETTRSVKPPLASVPERKSEYGMLDKPITELQPTQQVDHQEVINTPSPVQSIDRKMVNLPPPVQSMGSTSGERKPPQPRQSFDLPKFGSDSAFGDDFWGSTPQIGGRQSTVTQHESLPTTAAIVSPTTTEAPSRNTSHGFRTMVNKAFQPSDNSGVSKQDSIKSYGTSAGTSDISPILNPIQEVVTSTPETAPLVPPLEIASPVSKDKGTSEPGTADSLTDITPTKAQAPPVSTQQSIMKPLPVVPMDEDIDGNRPVSRDLPQPPKIGSGPSSRSASPSKSRVRDLATHFNDIESRRSSIVSVGSKNSAAEVRTTESPRPRTAEIVNPPSAPGQESHGATDLKRRPSMPGQFDSYALDSSELPTPAPDPHPMHELAERALAARDNGLDHALSPDLAPTTTPRKLEDKEASSGVMASLAAAGAAMGEAIQRSMSKNEDEPGHIRDSSSNSKPIGDLVANRPLAPQRFDTETSHLSSVSPTPPSRDEEVPPSVPEKNDTPASGLSGSKPPENLPRATSQAEEYSGADWLREEIDRSLIPLQSPGQAPVLKGDQKVSPISPPVNNEPKEIGPKLSKKFSWESSNLSTTASQLDIVDPALAASAQKPLPEPERPHTPDNARLIGDGLHVINSQPGELPKNATDPTVNQPDDTPTDLDATPRDKGKSIAPVAIASGGLGAVAAVAAVATGTNLSESKSDLNSAVPPPTLPKDLPSFREIQTIKTTSDRIAAYNNTRNSWATTNSGLDSWLQQTFSKYPEHESLKQGANISLVNSTYETPKTHRRITSLGKDFGGNTVDSPPRDKRTSSGAGKAVADGLKGLGGKGKGLLERMGRGRLRGGEGVGH